MEALETVINFWEDALVAYQTPTTSEDSEFCREIQTLVDLALQLQDRSELLFLDQRSVLFRNESLARGESALHRSMSDPNFDSAESFASALDQVGLYGYKRTWIFLISYSLLVIWPFIAIISASVNFPDCWHSRVWRVCRHIIRYGAISAVPKCNSASRRSRNSVSNAPHRAGQLWIRLRVFGQIALHPFGISIFIQGKAIKFSSMSKCKFEISCHPLVLIWITGWIDGSMGGRYGTPNFIRSPCAGGQRSKRLFRRIRSNVRLFTRPKQLAGHWKGAAAARC